MAMDETDRSATNSPALPRRSVLPTSFGAKDGFMVCIVGDGGREGGRVFLGLINFATKIQTHFQPVLYTGFQTFSPKW